MPRQAAALVLVLGLVLALASCGGEDERPAVTGAETPATTAADPGFARAIAVLETGEREIRVDVEVAETEAQQRRGLMHRTALAADAGMVFVFPKLTTGGFWMKDTLIPLSIAFYGARGRILRILDMEPCRADPCPIYDPGVAYRGALEVNEGAFARWGVREGDRLEIVR